MNLVIVCLAVLDAAEPWKGWVFRVTLEGWCTGL